MSSTAVEGVAAVVAGVVVFCGSVFFLLALVIGPRIAYFVTGSIVFGFLVILGLVWGFTNKQSPLGPVGQPQSYKPVAISTEASSIDFGPASDYPSGDEWSTPAKDDQAAQTKKSLLESAAGDQFKEAVSSKKIKGYTDPTDATANSDKTRFITQGDTEYGGVTIEPLPGKKGPDVTAILKYDPGNPLGEARKVLKYAVVLFVLHLIGLGVVERREAEAKARMNGQTT